MKNLIKPIKFFSFLFINAIALKHVNAQLGVGSVGGIGQSKFTGISATPKLQFMLGATSNYKFSDLFGLGIDITATTKGAVQKLEEKAGFPQSNYTYTETYNLVDIEIPLIARLYLGNEKLSFNLLGGVGMNFNVLAVSSRVYDDAGRNDSYGYTGKKLSGINPTNLAYTYGAGLTARAAENYYYINLRGNGGLQSFGTINGIAVTHSGYMLTVGYLFY